jgi:hypothetical protein
MPQPDYSIYKVSPDGESVWIANANNLQGARIRATELAQNSSCQFVVYDLRNPERVVFETVTMHTPNSFTPNPS